MTATLQKRSLFDAVVAEPMELALSQPHQILLSTGSVALMGSFASSSGIVHPLAGYLIAIGVEWAYLRGLASDSRAQTAWGGILNWSAFGIVVLWGVLWVAQTLGVFSESSGGWWLAAAHVVPVAWLSLCSAQCHRAAIGEEKKEAARAKAREDAWQREQAEEDKKLARWAEAQRIKTAQEIEHLEAKARIKAAGMMPKNVGIVPETKGKTALCCKCQKEVAWSTPSEAGTIKRWGCAECRSGQNTQQ